MKIDLANRTIEKLKIRKEREKFYREQIKQTDEYDEKYSERISTSRKILDEINEKYDKLYEENKILLSEKSEIILEEMLKRAREIMEETGENPFELN